MFKVVNSNKFEATGGTNQQINVNPFAIRKTINVKRLKNQLWDVLQDKIESEIEGIANDVTLASVMDDMYFGSKQIDPVNVSV